MSALVRRVLALVAALLLTAHPVLAADEVQHLYAVRVNGQPVSTGSVILERPDGTLLAAEDDLTAWGFELKGRAPATVFGQAPYYSLRDFTDLRTNLDARTQTLDIEAPPILFVPTKIRLPGLLGGQPVFTRGAYLNYDLDAQHVTAGTGTSNLFTLGYTGLPGGAVVINRFDEIGAPGRTPMWARIGTTYQRDSLKGLGTVRVGDVVSSGGLLGAPAAFAGIQRATDFDIDPSLVIFPTLTAGGVSQTQSTVDVYVNDVQQARRGVPAGPFTVSNLPTIDGQGNVTLVVHDIYGRDHVIVTPFYFSRALLRPGLSQSSFGAGVLRRDFGTGLGSYGGGLAYGTIRHGYSNNFTAEAHVEESGEVRLAELGGDVVATRLGVFHFGLAESWTPGATGLRGLLGYEFSGLHGTSAFANVDAQGTNFASLGRSAFGEAVTTTAGIHKSFRGGRQLSAALINRNQPGLAATTAVSAGYDTLIGTGTWHFAVTKALPTGAVGGAVQFSLLPGLRRNVDGQANFGSAGSLARVAAHQSAPPDGFGTGYDLGVGRNPGAELDGTVYARSPQGSAQLAFIESSGNNGGSAFDLRLLGGLALVDGHLSATDQVTSSYGLVEVPGFPNVRVYNGARLVGRTDAQGRVFISDLVPYEPNEITLDARDLPISVNFDSITARVTPYARNATVIRFKGRPAGGVLIRTVDAGGAPLPVGTSLASANGAASWTVARDGVAYLRGVRSGPLAIVATGAGAATCRFTLEIPANTAEIPDLGPQTCAPSAAQAALASPATP